MLYKAQASNYIKNLFAVISPLKLLAFGFWVLPAP